MGAAGRDGLLRCLSSVPLVAVPADCLPVTVRLVSPQTQALRMWACRPWRRHAIVELVDLVSGDGYTRLSWTVQKSEYDGGLKFRVRLQCAQRTR